MTKWIGNIFGNTVPSTATPAQSAIYDFFDQYYLTQEGGWKLPLQGLTATGGVISDYSDPGPGAVYRAHIFTSSGTFDVSAIGDYPAAADVLVVGGGGGGAPSPVSGPVAGGGGGGGGLIYRPALPVSTTSYTITVGGGGAPNALVGGFSAFGDDGASPFPASSLIAIGGGVGARGPNITSGNEGGSGGGGDDGVVGSSGIQTSSPNPRSIPADSITYGFGNPGGQGNGFAPGYSGGGGGGAGGSGFAAEGPNIGTGHGGIGKQYLIAGPPATTQPIGAPGPSPGGGWFSGGGGGGFRAAPGPFTGYIGQGGGPGGPYSGGAPGNGGGVSAANGTSSTGGGGGGSGNGGKGGSGGSGIVVVRYQIGQLTATAKATGGAISYYNGKTIHTFTSSGTFAVTNVTLTSVEYVVVGGGAGGATNIASGGGGGGVNTGSTPVSPGPYSIVIGSGGASYTNGSTSTFGPGPINAGGGVTSSPGYPSPNGGASGTPQSNAGGPASGGSPSPGNQGWFTGGGGGAGGTGGAYSPTPSPGVSGAGGVGLQAPPSFRNPASGAGTPGPNPGGHYFGGGGGGGVWATPNNAEEDGLPRTGVGGAGGGGRGVISPEYPGGSVGYLTAPRAGTVNTGGGGGGGTYQSSGGAGGSGIVLIAYPS